MTASRATCVGCEFCGAQCDDCGWVQFARTRTAAAEALWAHDQDEHKETT